VAALFSVLKMQKPGLQKGPGFMAALAGFVLGLKPRRPQAGFDLFNQIGAGKLYGKSTDYGRKGGVARERKEAFANVEKKMTMWQYFVIVRYELWRFLSS